MSKSLKKPVSRVEPYHSLSDQSVASAARTKPKSYSLPIELHDWLVAESGRRTFAEGKRVSASQLLSEIVEQYRRQ